MRVICSLLIGRVTATNRSADVLSRLAEEWQITSKSQNVDSTPVQIDSGLWALRLPLPLEGLRYVVSYVREVPKGIVLVDAGWNTPQSWASLESGLAHIGYNVHDVQAVVVTHAHPDHLGLAGPIRQESGALICLHERDALLVPTSTTKLTDFLSSYRRFLTECGAPLDEVLAVTEDMVEAVTYLDMPSPDRLMTDGEVLVDIDPSLRVIGTPGHSPGHVCLFDEKRRHVLTGDHVLPRVTPNVSRRPGQPSHPLAAYLASLRLLLGLEVDWVLPAHEWPLRDLDGRVNALLEHHDARLIETANTVAADPGLTTWSVAHQLPWSRPFESLTSDMRRAAVGEALAHLEWLENKQVVQRSIGKPWTWQIV
ncbi:MAG: MBL fold metallo-hydrolase [Actinomycetes bacterium]